LASYEAVRAQHLADIREAAPEHQRRLSFSRDQVETEQARKLREILTHARASSRWYADRLSGLDVREVGVAELEAIPVATKTELMASWDDVVTVPSLRRADLKRFLETQTEFDYYGERYQVFESGGSSGVKGLYVWDWEFFVVATNLAFRYEIRDARYPPARHLVRGVVTSGVPPHASTPLFSVDIAPAMETVVFPVGRPMAETVAAMNRLQPTHLIGYSSVIGQLAEEAELGRLQIRPLRVATNSEPLLPETRDLIARVWDVPVNNAWGSTEVGMHAAQCDRSPGLHVHEDAVILERVDEQDRPVADAEPAAKVLVTSLVNKTFPFIRYELDDVITYLDSPCSCGSNFRQIGEIQGRSLDAFLYGAVRIAPSVLGRALGRDPHVVEYQVRQTRAGAEVDVVGDPAVDCEELARSIESALAEAGLSRPVVAVRRVEELSRHPVTGKLKRFVPL
jgi:phenylacetate-coenzyme A ligase PaaK-like adenylate-forming protein